ncbi:hypothetical protein Y600_5828 [Burkholderia pseudomallei MSHR3709]|nr:hypothetical protein Y600_5828 [Burkholderia pseudomallei MSHR3709]
MKCHGNSGNNGNRWRRGLICLDYFVPKLFPNTHIFWEQTGYNCLRYATL